LKTLKALVQRIIVVNSSEDLKTMKGKLDYMISTIPYAYEMSAIDCVKPQVAHFTQVGQPINGQFKVYFNMIFNHVNFNGSLIGGIQGKTGRNGLLCW
jgi:alcohol dehydrogenase (NADP+)/uncharacterized zinc-type alcohol dehydrogenase-like protein